MAENAIVRPASRRRVAWWPQHSTRWSWLVVIAIVVAAVSWSFLSIRAVNVGEAFSDDLAHAWQTTWNVAHGNGFQHSHIPLHHNAPRLATHADYILILLAPLAWIWPSYAVLMVAQAVIAAIGAWFLFLLARRWLKDEGLSAVLAVCYLASGMVQFPVWWQFHGVTLAMTFILAMAEAIAARRRWWIAVLWLLLALLTKEQVGFIVGPLAWLVCRRVGQRRLGWWMLGGSVVYSLVHYFFVMPAFAPNEFPHLFWQFYFSSLGATPQEIIPKLLQPGELWRRLVELYTVDSMIVLVVPGILIPLAHPWTLLALAALLPHWLSDQSSVNGAYAQNHVLAVPILWLTTVAQLQRWQGRSWWGMIRKFLIGSLLLAAVLGSILRSPNSWSITGAAQRVIVDPDLPTIRSLLQDVPSSAILGYSWGLPPVSANRKTTHVLPYGLTENEYVIVHPSLAPIGERISSTYYQPLFSYFDHDPAFRTVYRSATIGLYQRLSGIVPGQLPGDFVDPSPAWTDHCWVNCQLLNK